MVSYSRLSVVLIFSIGLWLGIGASVVSSGLAVLGFGFAGAGV
jgi:hypothetical protein